MQATYYTTITVDFKAETNKAICVIYNGQDEWFPKSQIKEITKLGSSVKLKVPDWLLSKKHMGVKSSEIAPVKSSESTVKTEIQQTRPVYDNSWAFCDECQGDSFNIARLKGKFFVQCANCGKVLDLK